MLGLERRQKNRSSLSVFFTAVPGSIHGIELQGGATGAFRMIFLAFEILKMHQGPAQHRHRAANLSEFRYDQPGF
jgi:hypothetical protein